MSDAAAHILREAKSLHQGLKDLLKTREIADREIEIQRKNLRRQYLRLLFVHPYARESKDAETALWMQTSYSLISIFKQRIATLDRAISHPPRQGQQQPSHPPRTVEYRKLLQRFRQFLAEEEKFWTQLVLRIRRHFALDDAQPALTALGVTYEDEQASSAAGSTADSTGSAAGGATNPSRRNQFQFPPELDAGGVVIVPTSAAQRESRLAILSKALVCLGDIARYKEQYNESGGRPRAGHEDGPPAAVAGRGGRGRRGGPANHAAPNHMALPRLRNYDRAQSCYEQARLLLPHDGNPSHQLAILSSYHKDTFSSLVHYYRALCVRQPFDTAAENMGTVLNKALDTYKSRGLLREREMNDDAANGVAITPRVRVEAFKEKVVVLHAQWCMNVDEAKSMGENVVKDFADLVADRILPIDMISKVVVLAQGALWKHRMVRRPGHGDRRHNKLHATESDIVTHLIATHRVLLTNGSVELSESPPEDAAETDLAQRITATFRRTLPALRMAGKWLRANTRYISQSRRQAPMDDGSTPTTPSRNAWRGRDKKHTAPPVVVNGLDAFWREYARFCSTLLRAFPLEALPKLRTQLEEDIEMAGFLPLRKFMMGPDGRATGTGGGASPKDDTSDAGKTNGDANGIVNGNEVPPSENGSEQRSQSVRSVTRDQVHPNEEQLMRIADIIADAQAISEDENTPIGFEDAQFLCKIEGSTHSTEKSDLADTPAINGRQLPAVDSSPLVLPITDHSRVAEFDDEGSVTTRTDDDLIRAAFDQALSDPTEDDEIVWSPSGPLSPAEDPIVSTNPMTALPLPITPPRLNPIGTSPAGFITPRRPDPLSPTMRQPTFEQQRSPPSAATAFAPPLTTAEDLVKSVINFDSRALKGAQPRGPSVPPVNILFGSGPGDSIWSNSPKPFSSQGPHLSSPRNGNSTYFSQGSPSGPIGPPVPPLQNQWPSSQPQWQPQPQPQPPLPPPTLPGQHTHSQSSFIGGPLSAPFIPHQPPMMNGGHQRAPSESLPLSRNPSYGQQQLQLQNQRYDPFSYDLHAPVQETMSISGMMGRAQQLPLQEPLSSPTAPGGYGYLQNNIETAFYNIPNVGPSPPNPLRRDRILPAPYGPLSPTSRIWSNAG